MRLTAILGALLLALWSAPAHAQGGTGLTPACGTSNSNNATNAFVTGCAAPIAFFALTNGHIFVGNASNKPADVALSGDCTITNAGVISCTQPSIATNSQLWSGTANKFADAAGLVSSGQIVGVAYSATVAFDFHTFSNAVINLTGNITFANPTNVDPGHTGCIYINQDATGSRVATWGANWVAPGGVATALVLSTTPNITDVLCYQAVSSGEIFATLNKALSH